MLQWRSASSSLSKSGQGSEPAEFLAQVPVPGAEVPVSVSEFPVSSEEFPDPLIREFVHIVLTQKG
ncbi:MAG: hypothetical protein AAF967_12680, partial [Pseudomonadota bacterium]